MEQLVNAIIIASYGIIILLVLIMVGMFKYDTTHNKIVNSYVITTGELGEYGHIVTVNKNTDKPVDNYVYKLDSGQYKVTADGTVAFSIIKDGIAINENNEAYPEKLDCVGSAHILSENDLNNEANVEEIITINDDESIFVPTVNSKPVNIHFEKL